MSELLADVDAFEFVAPRSPAGLRFGELATATRTCMSESVRLWMSLERLYRSAGHLRPVHLRVGAGASTEKILAGRALCPFASAELRLSENDELLLVDRSDPYLWRVRLREESVDFNNIYYHHNSTLLMHLKLLFDQFRFSLVVSFN